LGRSGGEDWTSILAVKIVPKMQGFLESPAHLYLIPGNYP